MKPANPAILSLITMVIAATLPAPAQGIEFEHGSYRVTLEAFTNLTAARHDGAESLPDTIAYDARADAEARVLGLVSLGGDNALGARLTLRGASGPEDSSAEYAERSLIALGDGGRLELGRRRGLPDVLTGYAPNNYQFVSAEFGPASGASLDPDGGLQTAFIGSTAARAIGALVGSGITSAFFFDESTKLIYVSPKVNGFLGGVSYAPDMSDTDDRFKELTQFGLTHDSYWRQNLLHVGGTYTHAAGRDGTDDLDSVSLGATLVLENELILGASASYDGDSGLARGPAAPYGSTAYGYAASVNYNDGPWTVGGFIQRARQEGDTAGLGDDRLVAWEIGASYRTSTRVRFYGAVYHYRFEDEGGAGGLGRISGTVLLGGVRLAL